VSASQTTRDLLVEYYSAMESNDPRRYGAYYADEMTLTFGNSPTITGRENIVVAFKEVLSRVRSLHHDLANVWEQADGVVVYESTAIWNLFDGTGVSINACTVLTIAGGRFTDQRIYVDNAPLFTALDAGESEQR
jgi:ketosteroid isomerase-like protein